MASANSSGGVMGKMINARSIVVAGTAAKWTGCEQISLDVPGRFLVDNAPWPGL